MKRFVAIILGLLITFSVLAEEFLTDASSTSPDINGSNIIDDDFIYIEGGTFSMGSDNGSYYEKPVHSVTLSSFYMCDHEVTQAEYKAIMGYNPSYFAGDNRPVENVSWFDAVEYCNNLSLLHGLTPCYKYNEDDITCDWNANGYRLPTEAEWEYAARGGKISHEYTYSGSNILGRVAWNGSNSNKQTHEIKLKLPNELGLYDMSGNVSEWCWDCYGHYTEKNEKNPRGIFWESHRIIRGCSWLDDKSVVKRDYFIPDRVDMYIGFRVVRNGISNNNLFIDYITLGKMAYNEEDYEKSLEYFSNAREITDPEAQCYIGYMIYKGYGGISKDNQKAIEWFKKSALQGDTTAQYHLGTMYYDGYYNGKSTIKNYEKAFEWFEKAAVQGDAEAQYKLGWMYYFGEGITQNYEKAFEWFEKAAIQGDIVAQYNIGYMYYFGEGVTQSYKKAAEWFYSVKERGGTDAVEWYEKAAAQSDIVAIEVGSYELESMSEAGETLSMKELKDMYAEFGLPTPEFSIVLNADGTGKMTINDESTTIKWDAKAKTMTAEGETIKYTFKDNKITIGEKDDAMVFVKK